MLLLKCLVLPWSFVGHVWKDVQSLRMDKQVWAVEHGNVFQPRLDLPIGTQRLRQKVKIISTFAPQDCCTLPDTVMKIMATVSWFPSTHPPPTHRNTACVCRTYWPKCRRKRLDSMCSCWTCAAKGDSLSWRLTMSNYERTFWTLEIISPNGKSCEIFFCQRNPNDHILVQPGLIKVTANIVFGYATYVSHCLPLA